MNILLKGGTIVSSAGSEQADILISGEKIIKVGKDIKEENCTVKDITGKLVFPGFIDAHTHFDLYTCTNTADDFATGTIAAIAGGTTTVLDFATQNRGETLKEALDTWHEKARGKSSCDYGFHMSFSEWNDSLSKEIDDMVENGITSFKIYMAYDNLRVCDSDIYNILKRIKEIGGIVGTHCENGDLVKEGTAQLLKDGKTAPKYHPVSRPPIVEAEAVNRFLSIAELVEAPVNIVHLSTELGYITAENSRKRGNKVYLETCPQYLVMDDSCYETGTITGEDSSDEFAGAKFVMSPPLRKKSDNDCLWKALADNKLTCIATDHCSFNYKGDKEMGRDDFSKIPNGGPGVEHRPVIIYNLGVRTGKITKEQMCAYLSENPAKLYGMFPQKGIIAEGADADIVIWDTEKTDIISAKTQYQNCDYTPYEGLEITGIPTDVYLRGNHVVQDGKVTQKNAGKYVMRGKSQEV